MTDQPTQTLEEGEIPVEEEEEYSTEEEITIDEEDDIVFDEEDDDDVMGDGLNATEELLSAVLATPDGDTVCSALVHIGAQLEMQNKILIKILSKLT
jgi:hypothetical protein